MQIFTTSKVVNVFFLEISTLRQIFYDLLLTFQSLDPIPRLDNNPKTEKKENRKRRLINFLPLPYQVSIRL